VLRRITQTEIEKLLPGIAPEPLAQKMTSVVRHWTAQKLKAGVFFIPHRAWPPFCGGNPWEAIECSISKKCRLRCGDWTPKSTESYAMLFCEQPA
jgi:hypothetical protein